MAEAHISPHSPNENSNELAHESLALREVSYLSDVDLSDIELFPFSTPFDSESPLGRLVAQGPEVLSISELISLLLLHSTDDDPAVALHHAQEVLSLAGEGVTNPLAYLRHLNVHELVGLKEIAPLRAAAIVAAIELGKRVFHPSPPSGTTIDDPLIAVSAFSSDLMWAAEERFAVLFLDIKHRIIARKILTVGSTTETIAYPRDIFSEALRHRATRIIVAHNHPSGDLTPSSEDLSLTRQLLESGKFLGIPVLDHLILGRGASVSIREETSLWGEIPQNTNSPQVRNCADAHFLKCP